MTINLADGYTYMDEHDLDLLKLFQNKKTIILLNKIDLNLITTKSELEKKTKHPVIEVSVKEQRGLEVFSELIKKMFFEGKLTFNDQIYITNVRHKAAIQEAVDSLKMVLQSIEDDMPEDFFSIDLMNAYEALGRIMGESVGEDLINTIFSDFCMGK